MKKQIFFLLSVIDSCIIAEHIPAVAKPVPVKKILKETLKEFTEQSPQRSAAIRHLGGCYANLGNNGDARDIGRAVQGVSVDEVDNILYITGNRSSGQTEIFALRWDAGDPGKRTLLARSGPLWQVFAHQGTSVYRPARSHRPLFFTGGNEAASSSVKDDKEDVLKLKLVEWDYRDPKKAVIVRSWNLFDPKKYAAGCMNVSISPDNKQVIARAKRKRDDVYVYRIWDIQTLLSMKPLRDADATGSYAKTCDSAWGRVKKDGQAVAYDGQFIYLLGSDKALGPHRIAIMDDHGRKVTHTIKSYEGHDLFPDTERSEAESIFFIHRHGRAVPVLAVSVWHSHPVRKYCEFFDISGKLDRNRSKGK